MVNVLFDHNMSPYIAKALNEIILPDGHSAIALREKFRIDISDIDLYRSLSGKGSWLVISKDIKNAKKKTERAAIMQSGVLAFYLSKGTAKQPLNEQAATIIWHWPKLLVQRQSLANGMFELPLNKGSRFKSL
ncbi:MAG: hypothetical protein AAF701_04245 [Pseudomonadota bacterium]